MDQNVIVSIGIPIFNAERFLALSIKSVLNQKYKNFELILSDDGSIDHSLEIAKSFNDSRIIILSDGKNRGIFYRLNEQIAIAKGKYFVRMDADDLMFPDRIEKQVAFLEKNTNIDIVGSQAIVIDDNNKILGLRDSNLPTTINDALRKTVFIHPTVCGRIEWFRKFGYATGVEDFDLWLRSFKYSEFQKLNEPLLFYRDPLKLKFKTYSTRQNQLRKCVRRNRKLIKNIKYLVIFYVKSHIKTVLYFAAASSNLDRFLIAKRNVQTIRDITKYNDILLNLTI